MEQSIKLNIKQRIDGLELGEAAITRALEFDVKSYNPKFKEFLLSRLKDIFANGVYKLGHTLDVEERHEWIREIVAKDSPVFFETAIAMLEGAGYEVEISETKGRRELIKKIREYCGESVIEPSYKLLIEKSLPKLTDKQLRDIIETFQSEKQDFNKLL